MRIALLADVHANLPALKAVLAHAEGRKVDSYNTGVGNHNTLQELTLFRETAAKLKPDIIVLTYFINDAEPMPTYGQTSWLDEHSIWPPDSTSWPGPPT